jgi:hypothetical protein
LERPLISVVTQREREREREMTCFNLGAGNVEKGIFLIQDCKSL